MPQVGDNGNAHSEDLYAAFVPNANGVLDGIQEERSFPPMSQVCPFCYRPPRLSRLTFSTSAHGSLASISRLCHSPLFDSSLLNRRLVYLPFCSSNALLLSMLPPPPLAVLSLGSPHTS